MTDVKLEHKGKPLRDFHVCENDAGPGWVVRGVIWEGYVTTAATPGLPRRRYKNWNGPALPGWRTIRDAQAAFHAETGIIPLSPRDRAAGGHTPPALERTGTTEIGWTDLNLEALSAVVALSYHAASRRDVVVWRDLPEGVIARTGHPPQDGVHVSPEAFAQLADFARWNAASFSWLVVDEASLGMRLVPGSALEAEIAATPAPGLRR